MTRGSSATWPGAWRRPVVAPTSSPSTVAKVARALRRWCSRIMCRCRSCAGSPRCTGPSPRLVSPIRWCSLDRADSGSRTGVSLPWHWDATCWQWRARRCSRSGASRPNVATRATAPPVWQPSGPTGRRGLVVSDKAPKAGPLPGDPATGVAAPRTTPVVNHIRDGSRRPGGSAHRSPHHSGSAELARYEDPHGEGHRRCIARSWPTTGHPWLRGPATGRAATGGAAHGGLSPGLAPVPRRGDGEPTNDRAGVFSRRGLGNENSVADQRGLSARSSV